LNDFVNPPPAQVKKHPDKLIGYIDLLNSKKSDVKKATIVKCNVIKLLEWYEKHVKIGSIHS
jgi:hypothetical protein